MPLGQHPDIERLVKCFRDAAILRYEHDLQVWTDDRLHDIQTFERDAYYILRGMGGRGIGQNPPTLKECIDGLAAVFESLHPEQRYGIRSVVSGATMLCEGEQEGLEYLITLLNTLVPD